MSQIREQKQHIQDIGAARYITGTLRDIAALELSGLQKRFEQNSKVYGDLRTLYQTVWRIGVASGILEGMQRGGQHKRLYIAYTTNRHFYGSLNQNIIQTFLNKTGAGDECLILGDTGKVLWQSRKKKRKQVRYLSFTDDVPTKDEVLGLLDEVAGYDQVFVCYPAFVSVFEQRAEIVDITFRPSEGKEDDAFDTGPQFLLEPNLEEMLEFFNTQVRYALLERLLLETQLSRVAARLVKMDTADQNAEALLHKERQILQRAYVTMSSRRMLETLVGYLQWHKTAQHIAR